MVGCDLILVFGSEAGEGAHGMAGGGRAGNECAQCANCVAGGDGGDECGVARRGSSDPDQHYNMQGTPNDSSSSAPNDRTNPGGGDAPDMMEAGSAATGEGDNEMPVHSLILRLCSPLFDAMLQADMQESKSNRVAVNVCSKAEFEQFYKLMLPLGRDNFRLTPENIDSMLAISDFYQVEPLRSECAAFMSTVPATLPRVVLTWKLGLKEQYEAFLAQMSPTLDTADALLCVKAYPDIAADLMIQMRDRMETMRGHQVSAEKYAKLRGMKAQLAEARGAAFDEMPKTSMYGIFVRDTFSQVLDLLK